jgi:hypothetical protein
MYNGAKMEEGSMLPELKIIAKVIGVCTVIGGFAGLLVAGLGTELFSLSFFLWVAGGAATGAAVGPIFAYGFLPESGETEKS